jgi:hypothetical protein
MPKVMQVTQRTQSNRAAVLIYRKAFDIQQSRVDRDMSLISAFALVDCGHVFFPEKTMVVAAMKRN